MKQKFANPKDAAAAILLNEDLTKVLWARRNPILRFLGGFHGFVGGKIDESDSKTEVRNCTDSEMARYIACAARELFEEVGILLVRNGDKLTKGQRVSLHDELISGRSTFAEILELWGLWLDAEDFMYTGFWTTPEFSPMRFKTHFFIAKCPQKQEPYQAINELQEIEFIDFQKAYEMWENSKVLIAPPVLFSLRELTNSKDIKTATKNLLEKSQKVAGNIKYIAVNSRVICLPLRTKLEQKATHTNCYIVGKKEFAVINVANRDELELEKLLEILEDLIDKGGFCSEIIVSHLKQDDLIGEIELRKYISKKQDQEIQISANTETVKNFDKKQLENLDKEFNDQSILCFCDENDKEFELKVINTPENSSDFLEFYDEEFEILLSANKYGRK